MDNYLRPSRMWSVFVTIPLIGFIVGIASFYYTLKDLLLIGIPYDPITLEANYILPSYFSYMVVGLFVLQLIVTVVSIANYVYAFANLGRDKELSPGGKIAWGAILLSSGFITIPIYHFTRLLKIKHDTTDI